MIKASHEDEPASVGFLLLPNFSMLAFSSSVEPLKMANRLAGQRLYECFVIGEPDQPVRSGSGLSVSPDLSLREARKLDAIFICAGNQVRRHIDQRLIDWLAAMPKRKVVLGALGTGTCVLARAGVLTGSRCTIHWENMASLRREFPDLVISNELFEMDNNRYTCAGGTSALDMFLCEIRTAHGVGLATSVSEYLMCDRMRTNNDRQRVPLIQQFGNRQPKLIEAVELMEANIEEPISLLELSSHVGLSRRQLERLFQQYLQCVPTRYYLELRLERARQLLLQTSFQVAEIAGACGFSSAPHFSKSYRDMFGLPPREERRRASLRLDDTFNSVGLNGAKLSALRRTTAGSASAPVN